MKKITLLLGLVVSSNFAFANINKSNTNSIEQRFSPIGYWLQRNSNLNKNISIVRVFSSGKNEVSAEMFVPLSDIDNGNVKPPMIFCKECGSGNAYGHKYNYSSGKDKYQGLDFAWGVKTYGKYLSGSKGPMYDSGAVLNPNDGEYYHIKAQVIDYGKKVYVKAYMAFGLGKTEYWNRISEKTAKDVQKMCGLTKNNVYTYEDSNEKIVNYKLFNKCVNTNFSKGFKFGKQ